MTKTISQAELESYFWGAATILRGLVDAGDYKQGTSNNRKET